MTLDRWQARTILRLGLFGAVVGLFTGCSVADAAEAPTHFDLDVARTDRALEDSGLDGMAECNRFRNLQCTPAPHDPAKFRCTYREMRVGRWMPMTVVLRKEGSGWRWLRGDNPKCAIVIFN